VSRLCPHGQRLDLVGRRHVRSVLGRVRPGPRTTMNNLPRRRNGRSGMTKDTLAEVKLRLHRARAANLTSQKAIRTSRQMVASSHRLVGMHETIKR
jgi:hypothetical protein